MALEAPPDKALARRLVEDQFPDWARLPITPVASAGTDNAIFRLGQDWVIRLPVRESAVVLVEREQRWLPRLAPHLPLAAPAPLAVGRPAEGYPWPWSVCSWLEGTDAAASPIADPERAGAVLGRFLLALRGVDASEGPRAGLVNHGRGLPLRLLDRRVRSDLAALDGEIDTRPALTAWEAALAAAPWSGPGAWLHGDLHPGNLLVRGGEIVGVLDFGLMAVGDPACDLMVAWNLLDAHGREVFRGAAGVDAAMWARGRGWAAYGAAIALAYYRDRNPVLSAICRRTLAAL